MAEFTSYKEKLHRVRAFVFDVDGVLTNGQSLIMPDGQLLRSFNLKDGFALKYAADKGYLTAAISRGKNEGVRLRLQELGMTHIYLGAWDKLEAYKDLLAVAGLSGEEVLYMGDDLPDLEIMQRVGLSSCPRDAAPEIRAAVDYVSGKDGGHGCVRDVIEQTLRLQGNWPQV